MAHSLKTYRGNHNIQWRVLLDIQLFFVAIDTRMLLKSAVSVDKLAKSPSKHVFTYVFRVAMRAKSRYIFVFTYVQGENQRDGTR